MYVVEQGPGTSIRIRMPREEATQNDTESNNNKNEKKRRKTASPTPIPAEVTAPHGGAAGVGSIPETVLQYERQMRKIKAADRAGAPVSAEEHLRVIHDDEHVVVADKPSGVLCVPGVNNNPSLLTVVYEKYGCESNVMDSMIVHRLDMDTSGLVVFAKTNAALKAMHETFRERQVSKSYETLLCGHLPYDSGIIDLPLQRDHRHPPFMRVSTPQSEDEAAQAVKELKSHGWKKLVMKRPKQSQTNFRVLSREMYGQKYPVTRVKYTPITGRTHQLRVHSAAIGFPIVADPCYGIYGEAHANGGFTEDVLSQASPERASIDLQIQLNEAIQAEGKCMCLHAKELSFAHPVMGKEMTLVAPTPF
jgi:tRNA pseudouridine32 synthase/23S rRNA pseudouridine746 synthase